MEETVWLPSLWKVKPLVASLSSAPSLLVKSDFFFKTDKAYYFLTLEETYCSDAYYSLAINIKKKLFFCKEICLLYLLISMQNIKRFEVRRWWSEFPSGRRFWGLNRSHNGSETSEILLIFSANFHQNKVETWYERFYLDFISFQQIE